MQRGANRLTRNNAGRITSVGGAGATARGGRLRTASGKKRATVTTKISGGRSGVVGKPKGLKPGAVKVKAKATTQKNRKRITPEKVSRVASRVTAVNANAYSKTGIKRLNAIEASTRAKTFLTRKAGGMSGMSGKTYAQQQAIVAESMKKPIRYSTQKPNRNKPTAYTSLGQSNIRRKNQADANTERNLSAASGRAGNARRSIKAPDNARTRNNRLQTMNRRVRYLQQETDSTAYKKAVSARASALAARPAGTGSKVVFRGKNKAANRQHFVANQRTRGVGYELRNARPGAFSATAGGGRVGIRRSDTGNRQLSMLGVPAKKLYRSKRVKVQRPTGGRYGKR
jgi:hypothetical protein